jgi:ABC-type glutathione transport system ATPase component
VQALRVNGLGDGRQSRVALATRMLERVALDADCLARRPAQLSGGQLARVTLARALLLRPALLVLDEPTAGLDAQTKQGVVNLLRSLQESDGFAAVLVTHDLEVARGAADRLAVMHAGRLSALGRPGAELFALSATTSAKAGPGGVPSAPV